MSEGLAQSVARLRRALRRGARLADPGNPLTVTQLELLATLADVPRAGPDELARLLRMRQDRVTAMVSRLCGKDMIRQEAGGPDGRTVHLTVTDTGWRSVQAWQATNAAVLHLALAGLPERQRKALTSAIPALAALASAVDRLGGGPEPPSDRPAPSLPASSCCVRQDVTDGRRCQGPALSPGSRGCRRT